MLCLVSVRFIFSDCDSTIRKQNFNMILTPNYKTDKLQILVYTYSEESNMYDIK